MTFTASNGRTFDGHTVRDRSGYACHTLGKYTIDALREFFQHERDEELGRWRDPMNPRLTVYPTKGYENDEITILDEVDAEAYTITRASALRSQGGWWHDTAKAYFEAHPERKPWHDARLGEIWAFTLLRDPHECPWVRVDGAHAWASSEDIVNRISIDNSQIVSGRRIWPEE